MEWPSTLLNYMDEHGLATVIGFLFAVALLPTLERRHIRNLRAGLDLLQAHRASLKGLNGASTGKSEDAESGSGSTEPPLPLD